MNSDSDFYYEEKSENEQEVAGALHINVQVNLEESPESAEPGSPSLLLTPQPIPVGELSPVWELPDDGMIFIKFFTRADVVDLKQWLTTTRQRRNEEGYMMEEPMLSQIFVSLLIEYHGTQWEIEFTRVGAEPLFTQLLAYVAGYAGLTSHNKRIFQQRFDTWSMEVKNEQLRLLADSSGFLEID